MKNIRSEIGLISYNILYNNPYKIIEYNVFDEIRYDGFEFIKTPVIESIKELIFNPINFNLNKSLECGI